MPLLEAAAQPARVISILGAGFTATVDLADLGNTVKPRKGAFSTCWKGMMASHAYTDAWFAHLAAEHPTISFIHAHPGTVLTSALTFDLPTFPGAPLNWLGNYLVRRHPCLINAVPPAEAGEHMVWALFDAKLGFELRDRYGDVLSRKTFMEGEGIGEGDKKGVLNGTQMKGYSPSDVAVRAIVKHTEEVFVRVLAQSS